KKMLKEGVLNITEQEVLRDPLGQMPGLDRDGAFCPPALTEDQGRVLSVLEKELALTLTAGIGPLTEVEPWLLHGVTGSGKTEIYLRLIREALKAGRTAMLLVPEISLTPQLASRLKSRFGDSVAV